jgi:hypothetical protein
MATREEIARIVGLLRDSRPFWDYVKTLEDRRDAVIHQLLYEPQTSVIEALRGQARAYDEQIAQIKKALNP